MGNGPGPLEKAAAATPRCCRSSCQRTKSAHPSKSSQAKDTWEMDAAEKVVAAGALKDKGNAAFKAGNFRRAIQQYDKALQAIE